MQDPNVTSKTPIDPVLEEIEVRKEVEVEAMEEEVPPQEQLVELDQGSKNELLRFFNFFKSLTLCLLTSIWT